MDNMGFLSSVEARAGAKLWAVIKILPDVEANATTLSEIMEKIAGIVVGSIHYADSDEPVSEDEGEQGKAYERRLNLKSGENQEEEWEDMHKGRRVIQKFNFDGLAEGVIIEAQAGDIM